MGAVLHKSIPSIVRNSYAGRLPPIFPFQLAGRIRGGGALTKLVSRR
jgi:hypothetical protein